MMGLDNAQTASSLPIQDDEEVPLDEGKDESSPIAYYVQNNEDLIAKPSMAKTPELKKPTTRKQLVMCLAQLTNALATLIEEEEEVPNLVSSSAVSSSSSSSSAAAMISQANAARSIMKSPYSWTHTSQAKGSETDQPQTQLVHTKETIPVPLNLRDDLKDMQIDNLIKKACNITPIMPDMSSEHWHLWISTVWQ